MVDVVRGGDDADAQEQATDAAPTLTGDDDDDGFGTFETAADDDANVDVEGSKAGEQVEEQSEEQAPVAELSGDNGAGSDDEWGDFETPGEENVAAAAAVAESEADNAKDQPVPVPVDPDTDGTSSHTLTQPLLTMKTRAIHRLHMSSAIGCGHMRTRLLPCARLVIAPTAQAVND